MGDTVNDSVSVVIPTRGRPALLLRAVRSAFAQTRPPDEVIVVLDGADPETGALLDSLGDSRLRVVTLPAGSGGSATRNAGVAAANGAWIAFLDDDDEFLPGKLQAQLDAAAGSGASFPIVACRLHARAPRAEYVWPRRLPDRGEPLSEYLFARHSLFQGEGLVQTSMLLAPRALLQRVGFAPGLARHQDWDWVLRASEVPGATLLFVDRPLLVWHIEEERQSVSRSDDWLASLEWAQRSRERLGPRAYAAFLLVITASLAARRRHVGAAWRLLREAVAHGRPRPIDLLLFAGMWAVPQSLRRRLRASPQRVRRPGEIPCESYSW